MFNLIIIQRNDLKNDLLDSLYFSEANLNQLIKFDVRNYLTSFDVKKSKIYMEQNVENLELLNNFYLLTRISKVFDSFLKSIILK